MNEFSILSPTRISLYKYADTKKNRALNRVDKDKWFSLNLNEYRNAHFRILDQSKKTYHAIMERQLIAAEAHYLKLKHYTTEYQIIACNKRKFDVMNVICIVDKYFQDVMVDMGIVTDDSYKEYQRPYIMPVVFSKQYTENIVRINVVEIEPFGQQSLEL